MHLGSELGRLPSSSPQITKNLGLESPTATFSVDWSVQPDYSLLLKSDETTRFWEGGKRDPDEMEDYPLTIARTGRLTTQPHPLKFSAPQDETAHAPR